MTHQKGPHNRGQCPFYATQDDPMSAERSVCHCVDCVKTNSRYLQSYTEDLKQVAFLTIIEETPNYNPDHPSGASYTTFIKAKVCTRLWQERKKLLRYIPFSHEECPSCIDEQEDTQNNPLIDGLLAEACMIDNIADTVIEKIEIETLKKQLPKLMEGLPDKEQKVIELKFFEEKKQTAIASELHVSEGRVSQLKKTALEKLRKAYLAKLDRKDGNPYR